LQAQRDAENTENLMRIQEMITGKSPMSILAPGRRYQSEGVFLWHKSTKRIRRLHYILCNDCLILAIPRQSFGSTLKLKIKDMCHLVAADVQEGIVGEPKFGIMTGPKTYTVTLEGDADKEEWISQFYWLRSRCGPRFEKIAAMEKRSVIEQTIDTQRQPLKRSITEAVVSTRLQIETPVDTPTSRARCRSVMVL